MTRDKRFPTVGAALIFLGALLFGATVFLTSQMYQMNIEVRTLRFLWLVGVLPSAYLFRSALVTGLSALLACSWMAERLFGFSFMGNTPLIEGNIYAMPAFFIVAGFLLFEVGALHYDWPGYENVGRMYRYVGMKLALICLFMLTFRWTLAVYAQKNVIDGAVATKQLVVGFALASALSLGLSAFRYLKRPHREHTAFEHGLGVLLVLAAIAFFVWPPQIAVSYPAFRASISYGIPLVQLVYTVLFNALLGALIMLLFLVGYYREDIILVNGAVVWSCFLIIARYYDWFWDQLSHSIFFLVGGILLLVLGIVVEKKRRELKARFTL